MTSALSIVEVAFGKIEQDDRALDPAVERKIDALWSATGSTSARAERARSRPGRCS